MKRQETEMCRIPVHTKFVVIWAAVFFFVLAGTISAVEGPRIQFDSENFDFGNVKQGKVVNHAFKYTNVGDETLIIRGVRTTCGCTAAIVSGKRIDPGKDGLIKVSFDTTGYGGRTTKYIFVESNDPNAPQKQLSVSAAIDVPPAPQLELDSYTVDLGLVLDTEKIETVTEITNIGELELTVELNHKDAEFFQGDKKASFPIRIPSGKSAEVSIRLPARQRSGLLREYIMIRSNDPRRPSLSLYLSGYAVSKSELKELFKKYEDIIK
jgi:hypothetical protein